MRFGRLGIGSLLIVGLAAGWTVADEHPYHHFHHALWELRDARNELKEAKHDFGGHREKALHAVDEAIKQLDHILEYKDVSIKGVPTRGDLAAEYKKYKHHPHLHHALHEVRRAHHQIEETRHHNYGGHKGAALRAMDHAIHQIEECLRHHNG
jgi:hypothetical protein